VQWNDFVAKRTEHFNFVLHATAGALIMYQYADNLIEKFVFIWTWNTALFLALL